MQPRFYGVFFSRPVKGYGINQHQFNLNVIFRGIAAHLNQGPVFHSL